MARSAYFRLAIFLVAGCLLTGCYTVRTHYVSNSGARTSSTSRVISNSFLWGLVTVGSTNVENYCPPGQIKDVRSQMGGWTLLANFFTASIWSPMQVRVRCAESN
jgi:hypothetical protein